MMAALAVPSTAPMKLLSWVGTDAGSTQQWRSPATYRGYGAFSDALPSCSQASYARNASLSDTRETFFHALHRPRRHATTASSCQLMSFPECICHLLLASQQYH